MANNPQYMGGPGLPHRPMIGSIPPPQNIPPPMPPQFRPVVPMHPPQHFTPPSHQYQPLGPGIPSTNLGMPPTQSHQMQFSQPIQQPPARPMHPGHVPLPSQPILPPNVPLSRPMSYGLPQPASGSLPVAPPGHPPYAPNAYTTQYQPVSQVSLQSNSIPGPPLMPPTNQGSALFTPVHQTGQPSPSLSTNNAADSQPKSAVNSSSEWLEHMKNGRRYYYNKKTRKSTWDKPLELMSAIEIADATTDWKEFTSLDGRKYFYNKVTKQSKWSIPDEVKLAREHAEKASFAKEISGDAHILASASLSDTRTPCNADNSVVNLTPFKVSPETVPTISQTSASPSLVNLPHKEPETQANVAEVQPPSENLPAVPGTVYIEATSTETVLLPMNSSNASAEEAADSLQSVRGQDTEETNQSTSISGKINISDRDDKPVERETPTHASKMEAKEAFKILLESVNVESDWTWEQSIRLIINDKRYGTLKSLGERKQAFNEYLTHKRKQEAEGRRARNKKAKEDFRRMLEECSELTPSTRWGKAVYLFGNDDRFKAIERGNREDIFEEYLAELEDKERAKAEEDNLRYITEYRKFLESCNFIKGNSQWRKVKDRLEVDERCSRLETMDRLKYFQEYVGDLEKEEEEQKRILKEEIRKAERRNRDEFRKLMTEHISDGILTAKTIWREYHSKVKDLSAYLAISSNSSGSTPKELFEDVAEELNKKYEEDRTWIKDTVNSKKIPLSSSWTLEDFKAAIADDLSDLSASDDNLKSVFEELLERVREKEEKEAKRRKRLGDEFFNILCSIKDITVDSEWEDSLPLFQAREEFRSIDDESFAKQIYEEYLVELKEKEERKRKEEKVMKEKEREREREREKRSRDRREKDRKHDRDRGKDRSKRDEEDVEPELSDVSVLNESRKSGKYKDKKRRKRYHDIDDSDSDKNEDHSKSSRKHSSERKKSRHVDSPESEDDIKHKKHKRDHHIGSRKKVDSEELEYGELGN